MMISIFSDLIAGAQAQKEIIEMYLIYRVQNILTLHKTENDKGGIDLLATEILVLGQESGKIRTDLPIAILEDQFEFVFVEMVKQLTREPETFNPQSVIERCVDLFLNGIQQGQEKSRM